MLIYIMFIDGCPAACYTPDDMTAHQQAPHPDHDLPRLTPGSTRWAVLRALRALGPATASQIAHTVGVKAITVRHHLISLQAAGLVEAQEQRQAVGRPVHVYRLAPQADRLFSPTYRLLVDRLLDQITGSVEPATVERLIAALDGPLAEEARQHVASAPDEAARRLRLAGWLERQGLAAVWHETASGPQLVTYHCPYYAVSSRHPDHCRADGGPVRAALPPGAAQAACLLASDLSCALARIDQPGMSSR
jgi:predicted ArsR family transcriptional regulator